jgi:hypothetical protein
MENVTRMTPSDTVVTIFSSEVVRRVQSNLQGPNELLQDWVSTVVGSYESLSEIERRRLGFHKLTQEAARVAWTLQVLRGADDVVTEAIRGAVFHIGAV